MERGDERKFVKREGQIERFIFADETNDAVAHFFCRLVGECDCENFRRPHAGLDEMKHPACERFCFSRARARDDEERSLRVKRRLSLWLIQVRKILHGAYYNIERGAK